MTTTPTTAHTGRAHGMWPFFVYSGIGIVAFFVPVGIGGRRRSRSTTS